MTHTQKKQRGFVDFGFSLVALAILTAIVTITKPTTENKQGLAVNQSAYNVAETTKK